MGKLVIFLLGPVFLAIPGTILAKEGDQRWEILNPEGVIKIEPMEIMTSTSGGGHDLKSKVIFQLEGAKKMKIIMSKNLLPIRDAQRGGYS